jgi:hypothetical protein
MLKGSSIKTSQGRDLAFLADCFEKHFANRNYKLCVVIANMAVGRSGCWKWQGALAAAKWLAKETKGV